MLELQMDAVVIIAEEHTQARMGMDPAGQIVLQVRGLAETTEFLRDPELDLSAEVQFILLEDGIIPGKNDMLERDVILIGLAVMDPPAEHHAPVLLRILGIPEIVRVHVVDLLDAGILDEHLPDRRIGTEIRTVDLHVGIVVQDILQALALEDGRRLAPDNDLGLGGRLGGRRL